MNDKYKALIGIEMHCEISETNTKAFSSAKNSFGDLPNSNVSLVDVAFPGTLPVVNKEAVKKALMASIAIGCMQPEYLYFERKNYYYPDLPKGYQITQETKPAPIGVFGKVDYECNGEIKTAIIDNIHLEEDTAITTHFDNYSTIDYNRAGVPLLELVTKPCFNNADEVIAFLETIRSIYQYSNISEADITKGQIRCDVNISIMESCKDSNNLKNYGTKIEIKGVNSFSAIREVINYEISRQISLKENNTYDLMEQQTRRWDEDKKETVYMRNKANAIDYKYFVEPNIPKIKISKEWIEKIKKEIPELKLERIKRYRKLNLTEVEINTITKDKNISDYYDKCLEKIDSKVAANWLTGSILSFLNKTLEKIQNIYLTPDRLSEIVSLQEKGEISSKQAKDIVEIVLNDKKEPLNIIEELGMKQISDDSVIRNIIIKHLDERSDLVNDYKNGKNVFNFFIGCVMKETKGQANPSISAKILKEELERR